MSHKAWKIAQIISVAGLTWVMLGNADPHADPRLKGPLALVAAVVVAVIFTAFFTALIVNLWDWTRGGFRRVSAASEGLPFRAGRAVARLRSARRQRRQAVEERDGRRARLGGGELRQPPTTLG